MSRTLYIYAATLVHSLNCICYPPVPVLSTIEYIMLSKLTVKEHSDLSQVHEYELMYTPVRQRHSNSATVHLVVTNHAPPEHPVYGLYQQTQVKYNFFLLIDVYTLQ